jgi:2-methylcitrate dehydratase PrpD
MAAGMSSDADISKLTDGLGARWAVIETSFKFHASCRHTHPAADALLQAMREYHLSADNITRVRAYVHKAAIDVLGPVTDPQTIHQAKFSMGFVLALIALHGQAGVGEFTDESLQDQSIRDFLRRVEMVFDAEIDASYPQRWLGKVSLETTDGRWLTSRVDIPKGDPENTLSRTEIEDKARRLAAFRQGASPEEVNRLITRAWSLDCQPDVRDLLPCRDAEAD